MKQLHVPAIIRWPGKVPAGKVENSIVSGLDWFPTFVAAAGDPNIVDELKAGKQLGDQDLQGPSRRLRPDGPCSPAKVLGSAMRSGTSPSRGSASSASTTSSIASSTSRRAGRAEGRDQHADPDQYQAGSLSSVPPITGLLMGAPAYMQDFLAREFWRFVSGPQKVGELAQTAIEYPPMQKGASFNLACGKRADRSRNRQGTSRRLRREARAGDAGVGLTEEVRRCSLASSCRSWKRGRSLVR